LVARGLSRKGKGWFEQRLGSDVQVECLAMLVAFVAATHDGRDGDIDEHPAAALRQRDQRFDHRRFGMTDFTSGLGTRGTASSKAIA
jgi:hypothetical protein